MEKNRPQYHLQEILFGTENKLKSKRISALVRKGDARKIAPRLYTTNLEDKPDVIIKRNWFKILAAQYKGALLSHRSALECKPTKEGHIYLTYSYSRKITLPGLIIHLQQGHKPIEGDNSFYDELYCSQEARAYLENLEQARKQGGVSKTLTQEQIEAKLEAIIRVRGNDGLNALRDKARKIAPQLGLEKEFINLNKIISALLATQPSKALSSPVAKARALGEPFDPARIKLFELLYDHLTEQEFPDYVDKNITLKAYQNFAFYEGYFSNYIEGTILTIEDAKQVIATETPLPAQSEDSHDVLGTYKIVSNRVEMAHCPKTADELIAILRNRHEIILSARPAKKPGQFKEVNNRAGNTEFVDWELVTGTLKKGFEFYLLLKNAFARAAYMMFLISEVHPFVDGNGRIARIMMNAELSNRGMSKIIVPTVYREDYMGALSQLTKQGNVDTYVRMLLRLYSFSSTIYGENQNEMEKYLASCEAFEEPRKGKLQFKF